ncbi:hypothetical protein BX666DRAFT_1994809 [Dichotomocladium elegans]|nr:hypothetical protein BX666DRAFT_1994809 [Dichotomocladium elegans]
MNQEQHEMIIELFEVQRRSRELENEISLIKCKQLPKQQEPEIELECGQGLNPSIEEVQEEERLEVEEENVMVAETEFGRDFVMDLDEQDQQQAEVIQQLVKDNLKLQSTLSEYQQRYFSPALLDNEKYQSERDLLEIKRICDENIQLKEENDGLKRQAHQREIGFERVNPSSSRTPMKIIGELLHDREGRDAAEEWAKELAFELKIKETNEYNLTKTIDDLKNKVAMLKEAKHSAEIKKEALVHDKRMVQMHCDLLDQQLKEASLGSDNNNIKYPMTKRIEELEGLLKKFQEEAEKAKQEAVTALGEQHIQLKRPSL